MKWWRWCLQYVLSNQQSRNKKTCSVYYHFYDKEKHHILIFKMHEMAVLPKKKWLKQLFDFHNSCHFIFRRSTNRCSSVYNSSGALYVWVFRTERTTSLRSSSGCSLWANMSYALVCMFVSVFPSLSVEMSTASIVELLLLCCIVREAAWILIGVIELSRSVH